MRARDSTVGARMRGKRRLSLVVRGLAVSSGIALLGIGDARGQGAVDAVPNGGAARVQASANAEIDEVVAPERNVVTGESTEASLERRENTREEVDGPAEAEVFDEGWEFRDPFVMQGGGFGRSAGLRFTPGGQTGVPRLRLKAIVLSGDSTLGLIEIGSEGVFLVREGDIVSYRIGAGASNSVIKIKEINDLNLVVEAGTLGEIIVLR
jgi:hypothetical protein